MSSVDIEKVNGVWHATVSDIRGPRTDYISEHGIVWYNLYTGVRATFDIETYLEDRLKFMELKDKFHG